MWHRPLLHISYLPIQVLKTSLQKGTSFIFNPVPSWSLNAQRTRLPIAKNKNDILYLLEQNQVLVIVGDTGCGKSTQIPQYLAEAGWTDSNTMIGKH